MQRVAQLLALSAAVVLSTATVVAQTRRGAEPPAVHPLRGAGSQPAEPFRVIGNIYYVGAVSISSHIVVTNDGLILLDTGTTQMGPGIRANIEKLGFRWRDIRLILSSHAHWDHVEGHAEMKEMTGAQVIALGDDAAAIATGIDNSAIGADGWTPTKVDRVLHDGDTVTLGEVTMHAHLTAGHTKGCTTWTTTVREGRKRHFVVFVGGTSINQGVKLLGNERHPGIAADYARTFRVLKELRADVFLAQHPDMYGMSDKYSRLQARPETNPFVDPDGYQRFVREEERKYAAQLQDERVANTR